MGTFEGIGLGINGDRGICGGVPRHVDPDKTRLDRPSRRVSGSFESLYFCASARGGRKRYQLVRMIDKIGSEAMIHVVPVWTVEYRGAVSEEVKAYRVNADSLFEVLQHFQKLNVWPTEPQWLRVTKEERQ